MNPFRRLRWSVVATLIVAVTLVRATATIAQSAFPQRLMAPLEPFSGNGSMFSYEATALAPGVAPLPITYAKASDVDANEIPLNITESVLEIEPAMESIAAQGPKPVHDASPAWLSVVPAHAQPEIGDIITVCATISQVEGLYAHDIRLSYIPEVIEVLDANPAYDGVQVWPGDTIVSDFEVRNRVEDGEIWYAITQLAPREAYSGSGTWSRSSQSETCRRLRLWLRLCQYNRP